MRQNQVTNHMNKFAPWIKWFMNTENVKHTNTESWMTIISRLYQDTKSDHLIQSSNETIKRRKGGAKNVYGKGVLLHIKFTLQKKYI